MGLSLHLFGIRPIDILIATAYTLWTHSTHVAWCHSPYCIQNRNLGWICKLNMAEYRRSIQASHDVGISNCINDIVHVLNSAVFPIHHNQSVFHHIFLIFSLHSHNTQPITLHHISFTFFRINDAQSVQHSIPSLSFFYTFLNHDYISR